MTSEHPQDKTFEARAEAVFYQHYDDLAKKTDRLFGYLFIFQWFLGILFALTISPKTWIGDSSQTHIHVYAAIFLGGMIAILPVYLAFMKPGAALNRIVVSISQILFSILFIHLTGGRIETHFHIFGSLAFLAFYRDFRPVLVATVVTATDHFIRGIFWPESVYGVLSATPWRALEHAAWVLFEDFILFYSIQLARNELKSVSESQVKLEDNFATVEHQVAVRTSELRESQRKILDQEQQLFTSSKMSALGEMAGGVAHEINNPLAAARNFASQMQELLEDEEINKPLLKEMATDLEKTTERIAQIIAGLRSFSRDGSKDPYQVVNLHKLFDETLCFCQARFKSSGVQLTLEDFDKNLSFEGRSTQISQVILNLLNNAFDSISHNSEKWIKISVLDEPNSVTIRIIDSGHGIPPEIIKKIFQPFFTTKEVGKGTGMGLSISTGIIQSHHGELRVDSKCPNTCFEIKLPKKQAVASASSAA